MSRDRATLRAVLLSAACVTVGCVAAALTSGLACKLALLFALAGLAAMLVQFAE